MPSWCFVFLCLNQSPHDKRGTGGLSCSLLYPQSPAHSRCLIDMGRKSCEL